MSVTPNRGIPLMEPSQSEPEVVYNAAMEILDVAETLEVEQLGSSPGVRGVTKIKFSGASVTDLGGGVIEVIVDTVTGGGSLELTDGTHDLTGVTKITVSGATVGGTAGAATLTVSGVGGGGASLKLASSLSVTSGAETPVTWSTTPVFDTGGYFSSSHPTRLTAPATGVYQLSASLFWTYAAASATVYAIFEVNGGTTARIAMSYVNTSGSLNNASNNLSALLSLTAGDYVEVVALQNIGSATIAGSAGETLSLFSMARVA